jgi:ubiquinone/menaquinone biosynthesis C-methylase UbiE
MTTDSGNPKLDRKVCTMGLAWALDNRVRRRLQNPDRILAELIRSGQKVLDIGCGPGVFSLAMARMVGDEGQVIAADLQQAMLDRLSKHARAEGLESRIRLHKCESDRIGLNDTVDFALAFYMVHEVPDPEAFLREVHDLLKPGGELLLVEPKFHVSAAGFRITIDLAHTIGFDTVAEPRIVLSRSALLRRD